MPKRACIHIGQRDALIIVDLQNDFCPGGSLAVPDGDKIVPIVNQLMQLFPHVFATKDWHPVNHSSFKEFGGSWPVHCVQGTRGSEFHPALDRIEPGAIFYKGFDQAKDSYSGFEAISFGDCWAPWPWVQGQKLSCTLEEALRASGGHGDYPCERIFVVGLATDYCVKATVLDGLKLGFEVYVLTDAIAAVNVSPGDGDKALKEMKAAGAKLCKSDDMHTADICLKRCST